MHKIQDFGMVCGGLITLVIHEASSLASRKHFALCIM